MTAAESKGLPDSRVAKLLTNYVGLVKARQMGLIAPDEEVVLQLTGSGFKDLRAALRAAGQPIPIRSLADVHP